MKHRLYLQTLRWAERWLSCWAQRLWLEAWSPDGGQSVVVLPRGHCWGQYSLMSSLIILMMKQNANLQTICKLGKTLTQQMLMLSKEPQQVKETKHSRKGILNSAPGEEQLHAPALAGDWMAGKQLCNPNGRASNVSLQQGRQFPFSGLNEEQDLTTYRLTLWSFLITGEATAEVLGPVLSSLVHRVMKTWKWVELGTVKMYLEHVTYTERLRSLPYLSWSRCAGASYSCIQTADEHES